MQIMEDGQVDVAHHESHCDDAKHNINILNSIRVHLGGQSQESYSGYKTVD